MPADRGGDRWAGAERIRWLRGRRDRRRRGWRALPDCGTFARDGTLMYPGGSDSLAPPRRRCPAVPQNPLMIRTRVPLVLWLLVVLAGAVSRADAAGGRASARQAPAAPRALVLYLPPAKPSMVCHEVAAARMVGNLLGHFD